MAWAAFSNRGERGPRGIGAENGLRPPGATPPTNNDDIIDLDDVFVNNHIYEVHVKSVCFENGFLQHPPMWEISHTVRVSVLGNVVALQSSALTGATTKSSWVGPASVSFAIVVTGPGEWKVRVTCSGPPPASGCTWRCKSSVLEDIDVS